MWNPFVINVSTLQNKNQGKIFFAFYKSLKNKIGFDLVAPEINCGKKNAQQT